MINLLPNDEYKQLHATRHNVLLIQLVIAASVCFIGTVLVVIASYTLIHTQESTALASEAESQQKIGQYSKVEQQSNAFKGNLKIAKQILDSSTSYRTMLINIAQVIPSGAIITNLDLDASIINTPTHITISTVSYEAAVQTKDALNNSKIAKDASLLSVTSGDASSTTGTNAHPYAAQINVTFTPEILNPQTTPKEEKK